MGMIIYGGVSSLELLIVSNCPLRRPYFVRQPQVSIVHAATTNHFGDSRRRRQQNLLVESVFGALLLLLRRRLVMVEFVTNQHSVLFDNRFKFQLRSMWIISYRIIFINKECLSVVVLSGGRRSSRRTSTTSIAAPERKTDTQSDSLQVRLTTLSSSVDLIARNDSICHEWRI